MNDYLSLNIKGSELNILVIGAGLVAYRKITKLLNTNDITISCLALTYDDKILALPINIIKEPFHNELLHQYNLIFLCTNDHIFNEEVTTYCLNHNILVNNATSKTTMSCKLMANFTDNGYEININSNFGLKANLAYKDKLHTLVKDHNDD